VDSNPAEEDGFLRAIKSFLAMFLLLRYYVSLLVIARGPWWVN
jgi:hypothetical protein